MRLRSLIIPVLAAASLMPVTATATERNYHRTYHSSYAHRRYVRHRRHQTIKRVGIGAAGGAAIGALAGGGTGAGIGAVAGAGAGLLYDRHEKHEGH